MVRNQNKRRRSVTDDRPTITSWDDIDFALHADYGLADLYEIGLKRGQIQQWLADEVISSTRIDGGVRVFNFGGLVAGAIAKEITAVLPRAPLKRIVDDMARQWKQSNIKTFDDVMGRPKNDPLVFKFKLTDPKVADSRGLDIIRNPNLRPVDEAEGHPVEIKFRINITKLISDLLAHFIEPIDQDDGETNTRSVER